MILSKNSWYKKYILLWKNIEENNDEKIGDIKIEQPEPLLLNGENNINVENINKNDFDDINDNININEEEKKISEKNENLMKNIEKKNTNLSLDRLKATLKASKSTKNIHKKKKKKKKMMLLIKTKRKKLI